MVFDLLLKYPFGDGNTNQPPTITAGDFGGSSPNFTDSVSDAESVAFSLGALAADEAVTWSIEAGNGAGKFAIDPDTGEITLAEELNWWNLNFLTGGSTYALTIRATDAGGAFDEVTLTVTVTSPYENGIQFLKLNETSGTDALDYSTVGTRDGVYSGVALNQIANPGGITAPLGDGVNDFCDLYSAALNTAFNGQLGTISLWFKAFDSAFWSGTTVRFLVHFRTQDNANFVEIVKGVSANTLSYIYRASLTQEQVDLTTSSTAWLHLALTWNKAGDQMIAYLNGSQTGSIQTSLNTWGSTLDSNKCALFAFGTDTTLPSKAYLSYYRLYADALPAAHIAKLAQEFVA